MSYYNEKTLLFPIKEGPHLAPSELRQVLKEPGFMQKSLTEIGLDNPDAISFAQLQKICHDLKQDHMLERIKPALKEVMDENEQINVNGLENFLAASTDLVLEKSMPTNERLESMFNYIAHGKSQLTPKEMYTEYISKG